MTLEQTIAICILFLTAVIVIPFIICFYLVIITKRKCYPMIAWIIAIIFLVFFCAIPIIIGLNKAINVLIGGA